MGSLFGDIGSAIGYASSGAERGRESQANESQLANYANLNTGVNPVYVNNPYAGLTGNQQANQAAMGALKDLQGVSSGGGLTPQESSALQAAQLSNAQQAGAATQAALNNAARSGTLNSGRAIAGELGAGQNAQNANAQAGAQAASNSAAQRMQAMGEVGQLGNQLNQTQFGQNLAQAQGTEANNQFNSAQNVAAQQATIGNQFAQAAGENQALGEKIALNQNQAGQIGQVGGELGNAAGQIAGAFVPGAGGVNGLMGMFGGGNTGSYSGSAQGAAMNPLGYS
jgi:hypothetical protein